MLDLQQRPAMTKKGTPTNQPPTYSVEFFHIYTDEKITPAHIRGMEYLQTVSKVWNVNSQTVVLIDDYNPTEATLTPEDVFAFLAKHNTLPDYWAYEGDLVAKADQLLDNLTDRRLERSYRRYIEARGKYPCSLLTATWYLTRLGVFNGATVLQKCKAQQDYKPAQRLINILPEGYKPVEARAHELIEKSIYSVYADMIQDLFYHADYDRELALF